ERLDALRRAVRDEDGEAIADLSARVQRLVKLLLVEKENAREILADPTELDEPIALLRRAAGDDFWSTFSEDPIEALEFLDTKVAPLSSAEQEMFLPYVATDLHAYAEHFPHFVIADGEM